MYMIDQLYIFRSCGKCNKGIEVLLSLCEQDLYLIVIRVVRGSKEADSSLEKIVPVLHCQICEERVLYPNTLLPQGLYFTLVKLLIVFPLHYKTFFCFLLSHE